MMFSAGQGQVGQGWIDWRYTVSKWTETGSMYRAVPPRPNMESVSYIV